MTSVVRALSEPEVRPKPFLKWAGGKSKLLPDIMARFPERFGRYHEPFLGGGAVFFALGPRRAILSDVNAELVGAYKALRDDVQGVIRALQRHRVTEEHYYRVRAMTRDGLTVVESAARMIYLNRTCYNGLYRVNRKGEFNVPYGRYDNPNICQEENLLRVSEALRGVDILHSEVFGVALRAKRGDLVYFDPPYDPLSQTASFTAYTSAGFGRDEQAHLAHCFRSMAERGVHVVLSNSDTPFIRDLYKGFRIDTVYARRAINSRADRRGHVTEVLVSST